MRKKIISTLGLICAAVYAVHAVWAAGLLTGLLPFSPVLLTLGRVLVCCLLAHAVLGLPAVLIRMFRSGRIYAKLNRDVIIQQISGILLICFAFYHGFYLSHQPGVLQLVIIELTLLATGIHIFTGLPKSTITMGWLREESGMRRAKWVSAAVTLAPTALAMAAFLLYYPNFYGG